MIAYIEPRCGNLGAFIQLIRPDAGGVESQGSMVWVDLVVEPNNPVPYKKLVDLPAGVFLRGLAWSTNGSCFIVGRYRWQGDIFLAERSTSR